MAKKKPVIEKPEPVKFDFDLQKALKGAPLITRDGRPVNNFRQMRKDSNYPYEAIVGAKSYCFTPSGTYWIGTPDPMDLFLAEATR